MLASRLFRSPLGPVQIASQRLDELATAIVAAIRRHSDVVLGNVIGSNMFNILGVLGIAAAVALILGAIGIYGVISYIVSQRTRELGVRLALGAEASDVRSMVLKQGLVLSGVGVVIGLGSAIGLTRLMGALLFEVEPTDAPTYAVVGFGLLGVALLASWVPARRAASTDPAGALRSE